MSPFKQTKRLSNVIVHKTNMNVYNINFLLYRIEIIIKYFVK